MAAETYAKTLDIAAASGPPPAGPAYAGLAEVAYQRNELDSAFRQVTEGIALCRQFLYPATLGAGLVTLAWIRQAQGDPGGALQAMGEAGRAALGPGVTGLARALALGCPQGYVRVFADEGAPMAALLARLVAAQKAERAAARGVPPGCLAKVLRAFGGQDDLRGVPGLVEQLTARELEVLVLLAAGMPNPRIAEQLVVSLDTVKKHVSHLLGKLGAANRTEAVTRARQLSLIP